MTETPPLPAVFHCTRCGYDLAGVPIADARVTCPECGLVVVTKDLRSHLAHKPWHWFEVVLVASPAWIGGSGLLLSRNSSDGISIAIVSVMAMGVSSIAGPLLYLVFGAMRSAFHPESPRRTLHVAFAWFLAGMASFGVLALITVLPQ